jgi:hypothetical protein
MSEEARAAKEKKPRRSESEESELKDIDGTNRLYTLSK